MLDFYQAAVDSDVFHGHDNDLHSAAMGISGEGGVAVLSVVLFFESAIFPTIFTLSIRGLGRLTNRGSSCIVASVSGGGAFPFTYRIADHQDCHIAMVIPPVGFFIAFAFPIYLNTLCTRELDGFRETKMGYEDEHVTIGDVVHEDLNSSLVESEKGTSNLHPEKGLYSNGP